MTPLLDQLADRARRARALEIALLARLLLDERALDDVGRIDLSPESALIAGVIVEAPTSARIALLSCVRLEIHRARLRWGRDESHGRALRLARDVAQATAQEIAEIGTVGHVVDFLRSVRRDENRPLPMRAAA